MVMPICVIRRRTAGNMRAIANTTPVVEIVRSAALPLYRRGGDRQLLMIVLNVNLATATITQQIVTTVSKLHSRNAVWTSMGNMRGAECVDLVNTTLMVLTVKGASRVTIDVPMYLSLPLWHVQNVNVTSDIQQGTVMI